MWDRKHDLLCWELRYNGLTPVFLWNCFMPDSLQYKDNISGLIISLGAGWRKFWILLKGSLRWPSARASGMTAGTPLQRNYCMYCCTTASFAFRELSFGDNLQLSKNRVVCQSSGLILPHCFLTVKPQMRDCGTLNWGCNFGSSVFSSESLFTTMSSLGRSKLWLRNPSWGRSCISWTDLSSCLLLFSWKQSSLLSLCLPPFLGNCSKGGMLFIIPPRNRLEREHVCASRLRVHCFCGVLFFQSRRWGSDFSFEETDGSSAAGLRPSLQ